MQEHHVCTISLNFSIISDQAIIRIFKTIAFFNWSTSDNITELVKLLSTIQIRLFISSQIINLSEYNSAYEKNSQLMSTKPETHKEVINST